MKRPLRVLHLEDEADYSDLVRDILCPELPAELTTVSGKREYEAALARDKFDIILADYSLPDYDGVSALKLAKERCPETPFLLLSGVVKEGVAIQTLRAGATDYVLKSFPERLVPAVQRALREAAERDVRKGVEVKLLREEQRFQIFTENALDVLSVMNARGAITYASPSVKGVLGFSSADILGKRVIRLVHPEDRNSAVARLKSLLAGESQTERLELRVAHNSGGWKYIEAAIQNRLKDAQIKGMVVNFRDITRRKLAERELRQSEEQWRLVFDGNPNPMWILDAETLAFLAVNDAALQHYGYSRDEFFKLTLRDLCANGNERSGGGASCLPPVDCLHMLSEKDAWPRKVGSGTSKHLKKDGTPIDVEVKWSPVRFKNQAAFLTMVNDITERNRAEEALRSSETLFHSVWENSVDGMRLTDAGGFIVTVNQAFCTLVGMERNELVGKPFTVVYASTEDHEHILRRYRERFAARSCEKQVERQLALRNGKLIVLEDTSSFVEQKGEAPLVLSLFRDVTSQRKLEDQLRQSQKMEAIGQLAGGVAHDFNNILTVIHGHASLLLQADLSDPNMTRSARQIVLAAERAAGLTRQLLTFGRRQMIQPRRLDMNSVVANMTRMLGRILGEDIALKLEYSSCPATVMADAGMLEQVLLNLSVNSRDAMPKGGALLIRIETVEVGVEHVRKQPQAHPGRFVCLAVRDSGCGIPAENLRRVFEPFFTTKEVGKGTGLGLATVYAIVTQHQGWIEVESALGQGAEFRIYFPYRSELPDPVEVSAVPEDVRGGKETILVVEDEQPVRELVCDLLARKGYRILNAESGPKALDLWKSCKGEVDLLLTDLIMPDRMNGRELAESLLAERPDLKVILTTGYSMEVLGKEFSRGTALRYLQKPYHPLRLVKAVRECLD